MSKLADLKKEVAGVLIEKSNIFLNHKRYTFYQQTIKRIKENPGMLLKDLRMGDGRNCYLTRMTGYVKDYTLPNNKIKKFVALNTEVFEMFEKKDVDKIIDYLFTMYKLHFSDNESPVVIFKNELLEEFRKNPIIEWNKFKNNSALKNKFKQQQLLGAVAIMELLGFIDIEKKSSLENSTPSPRVYITKNTKHIQNFNELKDLLSLEGAKK